jgi:hypothetical protein
VLIVAYLMACFLVALSGRHRRFGFVGALFLSLMLTPILSFLVLWLTGPVATAPVVDRRVAAPPVVH